MSINKSLSVDSFANAIKSLADSLRTTQPNLNNNGISDKAFITAKIPKISLCEFFGRILQYAKLDQATVVCIFIYIERIADKIELTWFNIHKIIIASMLTSVKMNMDEIFPNSFYARIGGISLEEINFIEISFYNLIKYDLYVDSACYEEYESAIY